MGYFGLAAIEDAAFIATELMTGEIVNRVTSIIAAGKEAKYVLSQSWKNWDSYMVKRGWTESSIKEALTTEGIPHAGDNFLNPGNPMTRFINPTTGQSLIQDSVTSEIIQLGGPGFKW